MKIEEEKGTHLTAEEVEEAGLPTTIARPAAVEPRFFTRGRMQFQQTLREAANFRELRKTPYGLRPVAILTLITAAATLDTRVLGAAIPEISLDLDIRVVSVIEILSTAAFFLIFIAIGLAYFADRVRRTPFIGIGAIIMGIASFMSTRVTRGSSAAGQFAAVRGLDTVGAEALSTPTASMLADYYPPETRGKVFALTGVIARVVGLAAPLTIAWLVSATDLKWRLPYLISAPLLIVSGIIALLVLKEPIRGYMERKAMGADEEVARTPEEPPSFGEAWRGIWGIRTMRRLFVATIPGSAGDTVVTLFLGLYLFQEYQMDITERAWLASGVAAATLPFGFLAGGVVDVLLRRRPQRVLVFSGVLSLISAAFVGVIASYPPFWLLVAGFVLFGAASALIGPARSVLFVQIIPAHIRTLGTSMILLAAIPATIFRIFTIGFFVERWGLAGALWASVPFLFIGSLIEISAAAFFDRDVRAAIASQIASEEWRRAKERGKGKLLVCRNVDVEYDGVQVLFDVDFDVGEGEIIALLGTNGAGKSTLLKAIAGIQEASSGAIVFDGRDTTHMPPHEVSRRGGVLMPGGRGVFPGLTIRENILLGSWIAEENEIESRLKEVYELFPILAQRQGTLANTLSGGEQQMLALAQAFLQKPRLLMIDELSLGLSPAVVQQLIEVIKKIHQTGITIILVEQSVNVALTVAERCIFMEKGEVKFVGLTKDLLARPDILRAVYVKGTGALTESGGGALKSNRDLRQYELQHAGAVLEVKNVSKSYGGITAVDDVTFTLREGEVLGLIGPNGAGKTTLFDLISGYQLPSAGSILFDGIDVTKMGPDHRATRRLVRRFQDARLFPSLTVFENLLVALDQKLEARNVVVTALQLPQVRKSERRIRLRAERLLELLELSGFRDKFVKELSTGLRRITDLACVLATEPKVLLLDEPSSGIAQAEAEALAPLLRRVRFETGCSMLVIEHDMPLISAISDELIAMHQGKILLRGAPDEVLNDDRVIESYLGTSEETVRRSGIR